MKLKKIEKITLSEYDRRKENGDLQDDVLYVTRYGTSAKLPSVLNDYYTKVETKNLISNPNLLINGDFRINQRGQESYTNTTSSNTYTVDRWRMSLGNTGLNGTVITPKQNGGVNITCSNAYLGGATPFIQVIENPQNLIGKTLTFSVYCSAITSGSCRFRLSNYITFATGNLQVGLNQVSYIVPEGTTQLFCGIICNATTAFNIDIDYCKLEVGSVATAFSPRPYAEELAACQMPFDDNGISTTYSNPNLLINGDFRVNQRGQESYTATSADKVYTVDRWFISYAGTQLTKLSNGVNISISRQYGRIEQDIEDFDKFKGKTITLSAKINNTSLTRTTRPQLQLYDGINQKTVYIGGAGTYLMNFDVSNNATTLCVRLLTFSTDTNTDSIDIECFKLEVGSVATAFSPRPYAEELAMCQRYYQRVRVQGDTIYVADVNDLFPPIRTSTKMRALPKITVESNISVRGNGSIVGELTEITANVLYDNMILGRVQNPPITLSKGQMYVLVNGVLKLDAEI